MKKLARAALAGVALAAVAGPAMAVHSWGNYHWKRSAAELTVPVGDNVSGQWDSYLDMAIVDWNKSAYIQSSEVPGSANPRNCRAVAGTIQVCNHTYGNNGWLGIASISISGGHITQGTTKLNDTYFNTARYNTPAWRALVTCQEIGHDYGLGHQDEDFATDATQSCMDYTSIPEGNEHPDAHDYEQLATIYGGHVESGMTRTFSRGAAGAGVEIGDTPATWGRPVRFDRHGRPIVYERIDGPGLKTVIHVTWAIGEGPKRGHHGH